MEKHTNEGGVNIKDLFICSFITFRKGVKCIDFSLWNKALNSVLLLMVSQNKIFFC